jgi:hypothetical protein
LSKRKEHEVSKDPKCYFIIMGRISPWKFIATKKAYAGGTKSDNLLKKQHFQKNV